MNAAQRFISAHKGDFASADGLPGEFHRANLFDQTKVGSLAGLITQHGAVLCGRVVMKFATHAVVNLGGSHGTPGIVDSRNCVFAAGAKL